MHVCTVLHHSNCEHLAVKVSIGHYGLYTLNCSFKGVRFEYSVIENTAR